MTISTPRTQVHTIDAHYTAPGRASVYLIVQDGRAAFVDNNTAIATPLLLAALEEHGLRPEDVDYAIVTHVHLDHAGGTANLLDHCPNATALVHPKTQRHLANPERLVAAARMIYGDRFDSIYGEIAPVPEERMQIMEDGASLDWRGREWTFFYTLGHASHHFCVHDALDGIVFAGDNFGIAYPELQIGERPYIFPAATPTEFDAEESLKSLDRILSYNPEHVYLGHFGAFEVTEALVTKMRRTMTRCGELVVAADETGLEDSALQAHVSDAIEALTHDELRESGLPLDDSTLRWVGPDTMLNAMGLSAAVQNRRKRRADGA